MAERRSEFNAEIKRIVNEVASEPAPTCPECGSNKPARRECPSCFRGADHANREHESCVNNWHGGPRAEPAVERPTEPAKQFHENSGIAIPLYATMWEGNPAIPNRDEILAVVYKLMTAFTESELSSLINKLGSASQWKEVLLARNKTLVEEVEELKAALRQLVEAMRGGRFKCSILDAWDKAERLLGAEGELNG